MPGTYTRAATTLTAPKLHNYVLVIYAVLFTLFVLSCATTPNPEAVTKAEVHNKLAFSYLNNGQLNKAYIELHKALKFNPFNKETLNYLGIVSAKFNKKNDAISYYKRALSVDPDYSEASNNLGVTYAEIEDWDNAIKSFQAALNNPIYRTPGLAYSNMGYAYYKKGDYENAEKTLKEAIIRNPVSPRSMYILGLVYSEIGDIYAAIDSFLNAIGILPDYLDAHWELANAYIKTGNSDKALKHFKLLADKEQNTGRSREALEYIELFK